MPSGSLHCQAASEALTGGIGIGVILDFGGHPHHGMGEALCGCEASPTGEQGSIDRRTLTGMDFPFAASRIEPRNQNFHGLEFLCVKQTCQHDDLARCIDNNIARHA